MEQAIPASINYQDVLPVAVPAIARRRRFYPANGTTFNHAGTSEIRIQLMSSNSLLDPLHSYLEMFVNNADTAAAVFGFDIGGAHTLFEEISVEQGGRVLARQQAHNRLHAGILSITQTNVDGVFTDSITEGQRAANNPGGGQANQMLPIGGGGVGDEYSTNAHNNSAQLPNGAGIRLTMKMPTGLFTQDKMLPLPMIDNSSPLTLVLRMAEPAACGVWSADPTPGALNITRINYTAQLVEVGGDVLNQFRMMQQMGGGQLTISGTDIENSQDLIPNNSQGEQIIRVPLRKRSVKSLLFQMNSETFGAAASRSNTFNLSFGGNASMSGYQLKVGSVVYPPSAVECWGDPAAAPAAGASEPGLNRGECAMELAKALGTLGFTNPTGRLASINYGANNATAAGIAAGPLADGDNEDGAGNCVAPQSSEKVTCCPFGLDLASFQHTALESGLDSETLALETNLIVNCAGAGSGAEDKNVHTYLMYDQHYYFNSDGSITFSN